MRAAVTALRRLPEPAVVDLARRCDAGPAALDRLASSAVAPALREAARAVAAVAVADPSFAAGLLAAHREPDGAEETVDLVWTGPASGSTSHRLTEAVVDRLVGEATSRLLLMSYAVREVAELAHALRAAERRGVELVVVAERPEDKDRYTGRSDPFADLPVLRLAWPRDRRALGAAMHAKVLVVDDVAALIGSANLTESALTRNLECGVLLRGGAQPAQIWEHVMALRDAGVLQRVVSGNLRP